MATPVAIEGARERLVCAMNDAVAERGYGPTTIADVVRRARVSKRTFYEHFGDKENCFLAAYDAASAHVLGSMAQAAEAAAHAPWRERVERVVAAYLDAMASRPELTRIFLVEILGAGPRALARRRDTMERFADQMVAFCAELRREEPALRPVSHSLATAVVGGINELVLGAAEHDRAGELAQLREPATSMVRAVLT